MCPSNDCVAARTRTTSSWKNHLGRLFAFGRQLTSPQSAHDVAVPVAASLTFALPQ